MYLFVTNLRVPFDEADLGFLLLLDDYRLGPPVPRAPSERAPHPYSLEELREKGIIGLYMPRAEFDRPEIRKRTGWTEKTWRKREAHPSWWPPPSMPQPSTG